MSRWLICGMLCVWLNCGMLHAEGEDIVLQMVPRRVYVASDGVAPRWRVMLVAINKTAAPVSLEQVQVSLVTGDGPVTTTYRDDRLKEVAPGKREAAPGGPIILYLIDDGEAPAHPDRVEVTVSVKAAEATIESTCSFDLKPRTTICYRFPLPGKWIVANGRETQHGGGIGFAFDLMRPRDYQLVIHPPDRDLQLSDFRGYGQTVTSPGNGRVIAACGDRPDGVPSLKASPFAGKVPTDRSVMVGNYLVIDVGHGRCVLLAHLMQNSLHVQVGEEVRKGQVVGCVGNSGNTNAPHLHIEVLDGNPDLSCLASARFAQSGIPFGFSNVRVERNGILTRVGHCIPIHRDIIYGG